MMRGQKNIKKWNIVHLTWLVYFRNGPCVHLFTYLSQQDV